MKTIRLFFALVVTGFVTMSMGFPTDLATGNDMEEKEACMASSPEVALRVKPEATSNKAVTDAAEEDPIQELSMPLLAMQSKITLKVFDVKGTLVMNQQVSMDEFLGKSKTVSLPTGSTFVMFHDNTAYYFLETGLI